MNGGGGGGGVGLDNAFIPLFTVFAVVVYYYFFFASLDPEMA